MTNSLFVTELDVLWARLSVMRKVGSYEYRA